MMKRSVDDAAYLDVLAHLRAGLRSGDRATFEADFWPRAPYAQRFIRDLQARLTADPASATYAEGMRGLRALMVILGGHRALPGRPRGQALDRATTNRLQFIRNAYLSRLRLKYLERNTLRRRIDEIVQFELSQKDRHILNRLLAKPALRVSELADHLAAWHCGVPLSRVREAMRTADTDSSVIYG